MNKLTLHLPIFKNYNVPERPTNAFYLRKYDNDLDRSEYFWCDLLVFNGPDRNKDYVTFYVLDANNANYIDAAVNDLIVFGNASGVTPSSSVTIENL